MVYEIIAHPENRDIFTSTRFAGGGSDIVALLNDEIQIYDFKTGKFIRTIKLNDRRISAFDFYDFDLKIAVSHTDAVYTEEIKSAVSFLEYRSGEVIKTLDGWNDRVKFRGDFTLATREGGRFVKIWDLISDELSYTVDAEETVYSLDFSENLLAVNTETKILFIEWKSGKTVRVIDKKNKEGIGPSPLRFTPDQRRLVTVGGEGWETIYFRDAATGEIVESLDGHREPIFDLAFSPGLMKFASADREGTIVLWDPSRVGNPPEPSTEG